MKIVYCTSGRRHGLACHDMYLAEAYIGEPNRAKESKMSLHWLCTQGGKHYEYEIEYLEILHGIWSCGDCSE